MAKTKPSKQSKPQIAVAPRAKPKVAKAKALKPKGSKTQAAKPKVAKPKVTKPKIAKSVAQRLPAKKPPRNAVAVTGIVGLSTEEGVFLIAATEQGKEELFDFRLAVKEPFPRAVNVGAAKCVRASAVVADTSTQPARQLHLSFISVPSGLQVEGNHLYRARTEKKQEVFFSVPTQKYQSFEADKLTRVLAVLSDGFKELMPRILGKDHELTQKLMVILQKKAEIEFWNATQQKVKDLLQAGQPERALGVLEPLVFSVQPHQQAEKLLGDLLYSFAKKPEGSADGISQSALKQLATETLMVQWLLKKVDSA